MKIPPACNPALRRWFAVASACLLLSSGHLAHAGAMRTDYRFTGLNPIPAGIDAAGNMVMTGGPYSWNAGVGDRASYVRFDGLLTVLDPPSGLVVDVVRPRISPAGTVVVTHLHGTHNGVPGDHDSSQILLYRDGLTTNLGRLSPEPPPGGLTVSHVDAINDRGDLAGTTENYIESGSNVFVSRDTGGGRRDYLDLGTLGGRWSSVGGINASGQIVGTSQTASGEFHAFMTREVGGATRLVDLGTLGGTASAATAINDAGQVVGYSEVTSSAPRPFSPDNVVHAMLISGGVMQDLGTLAGDTRSMANAINNAGVIVGRSYKYPSMPGQNAVGDGPDSRAFVRFLDGTMLDLNEFITDPRWHLVEATGINDANQIVGYGYYDDPFRGRQVLGFRVEPVPEPSTFVIFAAAGAGLWYARSRHAPEFLHLPG